MPTTYPSRPTLSPAGIAEAPLPQQTSRTRSPGFRDSRSTVLRPKLSQNVLTAESKQSAAASYAATALAFASSWAVIVSEGRHGAPASSWISLSERPLASFHSTRPFDSRPSSTPAAVEGELNV